MPSFLHLYIGVLLGILLVVLRTLWRRRQSVVSQMRGPPSPSWILGHEHALLAQDEVGNLEFSWFQQYGTALRLKSCFGGNDILISDAKALQHIFHTSGYRYPKTNDANHSANLILGNGLVTVGGSVHQRQRKVLNPAFSSAQLRTFSILFQRLSLELTATLRAMVNEEGKVVNMYEWLGKMTLDIIGESAFGYNFGALDGGSSELRVLLQDIFVEMKSRPMFDRIEFWMWRKLPGRLMNLIYRPSKQSLRALRFREAAVRYSRRLLAARANEETKVESTTGKDILSILVEANQAEEDKKRLDESEVLAQMSTMILAGHETSASSMSWILYELSQRQDQQDRIKREILDIRQRVGETGQFSPHDYDSMLFLNAVIKEGLRLHPIVSLLSRQPSENDIIPLAEPITTETGETITCIPVEKGQTIRVSLAYYNRNPVIWGGDANQWKPERFLETKDTTRENHVPLGVYANLMTFSAGIRACIGWRFALMEIQIILTQLLEHFEFALPHKPEAIKRGSTGLMLPLVRDKVVEGVQMPLHIEARAKI